MRTALKYVLLAYLSGSVLYARVFARLLGKQKLYDQSRDGNPGTANAYQYGGFLCGTLTLLGDLLKGFFPVYFCFRALPPGQSWALPLILAAPVLGHIFPIFYRFKGGKGIAVTFGCLLGLIPYSRPLLQFAMVFLLLSVGIRITPHFYRTFAAYPCTLLVMAATGVRPEICAGFFIIAAAVCLRLMASTEKKEKLEVKLLWKR